MRRAPHRLFPFLAVLALIASAAPLRAQEAGAWPHEISKDGATVEVYQPQATSWTDQKTLQARAALSIQRQGDKTPILGTIEVSFQTETDPASRIVTLTDPKLLGTHFPALDTGAAAALQDRIGEAVGRLAAKQVPLDSVLLSLKEVSGASARTVTLDNTPPEIFHSDRPASLVVFDGDPVMVPAGQSGLSYAVNTNWEVFSDPADKAWFLLANGTWYTAPDGTGPYRAVSKLPAAFSRLPNDANFAAVRKAIPPRQVDPAKAANIFATIKPAEIIVTDGPPKLSPIQGTTLQQVTNSNATLVLDTGSGKFYYLTSGRWFASTGLDGPWTYATPDLPADFALIPPESNAGAVLPSVPGTVQAQESVIRAGIPEQATLKRSEAKLTVAYVGTPSFQPTGANGVSYATNTTYEVLSVGGVYYACYQGAWFTGPTPQGPWTLAASVPPAIYTIPPSSPVYNVSYVNVYGATPATVTYGYTAGYALGFITAGALAYGTGYYYPPVVIPGRVPAYLPYPYTYAGGVYYNPATGAWARGGAVYGPYGAARGASYYNPSTGGYARAGAVYGPYGGAGAWSTYNPATGTYRHGSAAWGPEGGTAHGSFYNPRYGVAGSTTQNANAYGRWGSSTVAGPNRTVDTASGSNARGAAGGFSSSTGAQGAGVHNARTGSNTAVARGAGGNTYAGHDGNVYQHNQNGWSKWSNGGWNPVQPPSRSGSQTVGASQSSTQSRTQSRTQGQTLSQDDYSQLERDRGARQFGQAGQSPGGFDRGSFDRGNLDRGGGGFRQGGFGGGSGGGLGGGERRFR